MELSVKICDDDVASCGDLTIPTIEEELFAIVKPVFAGVGKDPAPEIKLTVLDVVDPNLFEVYYLCVVRFG